MTSGVLMARNPDGSSWTIRFPAPADWISANKRYKRRPNEQIRAWRQATAVHAAAARLPRGLPQVSICATLHFPDRRRRDAHNFMLTVKSCIDGFVDYGLILDDRREHVLWTGVSEGESVPKRPYGPAGEITLTVVQVQGQVSPLGMSSVTLTARTPETMPVPPDGDPNGLQTLSEGGAS